MQTVRCVSHAHWVLCPTRTTHPTPAMSLLGFLRQLQVVFSSLPVCQFSSKKRGGVRNARTDRQSSSRRAPSDHPTSQDRSPNGHSKPRPACQRPLVQGGGHAACHTGPGGVHDSCIRELRSIISRSKEVRHRRSSPPFSPFSFVLLVCGFFFFFHRMV